MKIKSISIENFRNIEALNLEFDDVILSGAKMRRAKPIYWRRFTFSRDQNPSAAQGIRI
jgi:AAA15 family ATPase/GTPase